MTETQPKQPSFTSKEEILRLIQQALSSGKLTLLDVFCGMGGVSDGYSLEGFDVMGIDIVDAPKLLGYKHRFIQADMLTLKGEDFRGYDVVWGSPPCRDFSRIGDVYGKNWKEPPNPKKGLQLVDAYFRFVHSAEPGIWILENVYGLSKHLLAHPKLTTYISIGKNGQGKKHSFWGNFPDFLMPQDLTKRISYHVKGPNNERWMREYREGKIVGIQGKLRKWERAKIPLVCSRAFARACKEALQQ